MSFIPLPADNIICISVCLTCLFIYTFIGEDNYWINYPTELSLLSMTMFLLSSQLISFSAVEACYFL